MVKLSRAVTVETIVIKKDQSWLNDDMNRLRILSIASISRLREEKQDKSEADTEGEMLGEEERVKHDRAKRMVANTFTRTQDYSLKQDV